MKSSFASLSRNSLQLPTYDTRNLSFEKALTRSKINTTELNRILQMNKKYSIRNSLIKLESNYNAEINVKLKKVGNILRKIPHPKKQNNTMLPSRIPVTFKLMRKSNSVKTITTKSNAHDLEDYLVHFQQEIQSILVSNSHFAANSFQFSRFINKNKLRKLKTIYKYISDDKTAMKFHFFTEDFKQKGLNNTAVVNPEYKFIKIRDESFLVLNTFKKVITCIIDHFFMAYNNDLLFKRENSETLNEYSLYLKEMFEFYKIEIKDIVKNYSILTKGLVNSNKIYYDYVNELCKFTEDSSKEEVVFLRSYSEMMKMDTILHH